MSHVRARRDGLRDDEEVDFSERENIDLHFGHASLTGGTAVAVAQPDGSVVEVTAENLILATGSSPRLLPVDAAPTDRILDNESLFELESAPGRLVVIGAGAVGLETAAAFTRMGTRVTVLEAADQILPGLLPEVATVARSALTSTGIDLRPGLVAHRWDDDANGVVIGPMDGEAVETVPDVDAILLAVGRTPNTHGLGLGGANIQTAEDGRVQVDHRGRTNVEGVWAVGDLATTGATTHAAGSWGRRVVQSIVFPMLPAGKEPIQPTVVFTSPEIAAIGTLPTTTPPDVHRFTVDLASLDRAYTDEVAHTTMVVDVRRFSGRITGAAFVAPRASELVATVALLMHADVGLHRLVNMVMPYPTWSEAFRALEDQWMATALPQMHTDAGRWASTRFSRLRDRITGD